MNRRTLVNGQASTQLDIRDRGLAFGDGVFETIRVVDGTALFLPLHLARLARGCERLQIDLDPEQLRADIQSLLTPAPEPAAILKIIITRAYQSRGYGFTRPGSANRYLQLSADDEARRQRWQQGAALVFCQHRLPENPALAGIKHLNRLDNVLARAEWQDAAIDEGLMLDSNGRVVEGTMSNLFVVERDRLLTPALHRCGVAGVMRQLVIEQWAPQVGIGVEECDLSPEDVRRATELLVCNSLIGISPVIALDGEPRPRGTITQQLQRCLGDAIAHVLETG